MLSVKGLSDSLMTFIGEVVTPVSSPIEPKHRCDSPEMAGSDLSRDCHTGRLQCNHLFLINP